MLPCYFSTYPVLPTYGSFQLQAHPDSRGKVCPPDKLDVCHLSIVDAHHVLANLQELLGHLNLQLSQ